MKKNKRLIGAMVAVLGGLLLSALAIIIISLFVQLPTDVRGIVLGAVVGSYGGIFAYHKLAHWEHIDSPEETTPVVVRHE